MPGPDVEVAANAPANDAPMALAHPEINAELARLRVDRSFLHSLHEGMDVTFRRTDRDGVRFWRNRPAANLTWLRETVPFGELSVDIQTSALRHNLSDRGGLLEIRYSIAVEHTVTGRNSFKIRVKRKN